MVNFVAKNFALDSSLSESEKIPVVNPSNEEIIGFTFTTNNLRVENIVRLAKANKQNWSSISSPERGNILRNFLKKIELSKQDFIKIVCAETGKSQIDSVNEFEAMLEMGHLMASNGRRLNGITSHSKNSLKRISVWREPVGVCALIVASNTPLPNYAWKVFPALIAGNSVILKPSEFTPFSSTLFTEIALEAGIPASAFQLIHGDGETGSTLVNCDVDLISFTGSKETGMKIAKAAASKLTKVALELGGKNALIICDDADVELASDAAVASAFSNAGQRCAAASRIIVTEGVYEEFISSFYNKVNKLACGNSDSNSVGPVISAKSLERINKILNESIKKGARISAQGSNSNKKGFYIKPTVVTEVSPDDEISKVELFGPICCLYKVKNINEAIALANNSEYGLTSAIWTQNHSTAQLATNALEVGMVTVNGPTFGAEPNMPFGGVKNSGNGWRENGESVLDIYTEIKTVAENRI
ncbi:hypothetical protein GM51_4840 [freshwater metagenome]|uniref:Aldehyde dehydrogenase domain-containing protein n=1 Tax=freshwater metagenome TaxID=449393 RepID=A0A094SQD5_9ZZZZ